MNDKTSKVRFQDHNRNDIVVVEIATGKVEISDPSRVDEAAMLFWHAVERTWGRAQDIKIFRDMALRAATHGDGRAGDIVFAAGYGPRATDGATDQRGGDVVVFLELVRKKLLGQ